MKDRPEICRDLTEDQPPPWWLVLVIGSLVLIAGGVLALAATLAWVVWGLAA